MSTTAEESKVVEETKIEDTVKAELRSELAQYDDLLDQYKSGTKTAEDLVKFKEESIKSHYDVTAFAASRRDDLVSGDDKLRSEAEAAIQDVRDLAEAAEIEFGVSEELKGVDLGVTPPSPPRSPPGSPRASSGSGGAINFDTTPADAWTFSVVADDEIYVKRPDDSTGLQKMLSLNPNASPKLFWTPVLVREICAYLVESQYLQKKYPRHLEHLAWTAFSKPYLPDHVDLVLSLQQLLRVWMADCVTDDKCIGRPSRRMLEDRELRKILLAYKNMRDEYASLSTPAPAVAAVSVP